MPRNGSVGLNGRARLCEDAYTNRPGEVVAASSTAAALEAAWAVRSAGTVTLSSADAGFVVREDGADDPIVLPYSWRVNGDDQYWSFDQVANIATNTGGLECYFINGFRDRPKIAGANNLNGLILTKKADAVVWAHEIGHACGMEDVYVEELNSNVPFEEGFEYRHAEHDWNGGSMGENTSGSRYYALGENHRSILKRLLMNGHVDSMGCDITTGEVEGVRYVFRNPDCTERGDAKTGIYQCPQTTRTPMHE